MLIARNMACGLWLKNKMFTMKVIFDITVIHEFYC